MTKELEAQVYARANHRCEYCHVPTIAYQSPFQIDHVIASKHGGATVFSNLALSCFHCNIHKGPNIAGLDPPGTGPLVRLFNPRTDGWGDHFRYEGAVLVGLTPIGRATLHVLNINDPLAVGVTEAPSSPRQNAPLCERMLPKRFGYW